MSPPFRFNHLTGQRVRVPGPRFGEIVSALYDEGGNLAELKVWLDKSRRVERFPVNSCFLILPEFVVTDN